MFSPLKFCNGTVEIVNGTLAIKHKLEQSPSSMFVLDFAGSGAVHLLGGMGGLLLTIFFKVEQWFENCYKSDERINKVIVAFEFYASIAKCFAY